MLHAGNQSGAHCVRYTCMYYLHDEHAAVSDYCRYVLMFNWGEYVVTIRQLEPLPKFDKWWITKPLCIEGETNPDIIIYPCMVI